MKKILSILTLIVLCTVLTSCSDNSQNSKQSEDNAQTSADKKVKVAFIFPGPINDGGWVTSHNEGRLYVEQKLGIKTICIQNVKESPEIIDIISDLIDKEGVNVVFGPSFGFQAYFSELADKYPSVKFLTDSGGNINIKQNMGAYFGALEEGYYLSGILAAEKTKSDKLGFVGAFPVPEIIRSINASYLGAKSVNPNIKLYVKWTKSWSDESAERAAAESLIKQKCDVLFQAQNTPTTQIVAQENGAFAVGCYADMNSYAPKSNLGSASWNWGPYYYSQIKSIMDGKWRAENIWGSLKDGMVVLSGPSSLNSDSSKALVKKAESDIKSGKLVIFKGPLTDNNGKLVLSSGETLSYEKMQTMSWLLEGVTGDITD